MSARWALILFLFIALAIKSKAAELPTSGSLLEEVLTKIPDPHRYDWRETPLQVSLGYGEIEEENSFKSASYSLELARTFTTGWLMRGGVRRVVTTSTASSDSLAQTPFSQAGQPSRYELFAGAAYSLLDGRMATPLASRVTDLGGIFYALADIQYNKFDSDDPEPVAGMRAVEATIVGSLGLRYQIYLPQNLGVGFEWELSTPLAHGGDPDLAFWQRLGATVSWTFGPGAFE